MRTPARYTEIAPAALALEDKTFSPSVIQSTTFSHVGAHKQANTSLNTHCRINTGVENFPPAFLMKFPQHQGDTAGLRKQAPVLFLLVTKCSSSR